LSQSYVGGKRRRAEGHLHKGGVNEKREIGVLTEVVYMMKSGGPRTALIGNTTRGSMKGREVIIFNTKGAR